MYYDDLPLWGFVGKVEAENLALDGKGPNYFLFNHIQFNALYSGNQVIEIHAFGDPTHIVDMSKDFDLNITFTYSVSWNETSTPFKNRMGRYLRTSLLPIHQRIHSFSFINSICIIVCQMGLLVLFFLRYLKKDLRSPRHSGGDEEEDMDVGKRYTHYDAFRCPQQLPLFCAVLGCGTQLLILVFLLCTLAFAGVIYPYSRGALSTSLIGMYTLTSAVAGYISASFYSHFAETGWERSVLLSGMLFVGPSLSVVLILNIVAACFGTTAALPFSTMFIVFFVHIVVGIPLLAIGGVVGYKYRSESKSSCATKKWPREVPSLPWHRRTPSQMFIGGLLPFSAIALELHQLYTSIWGYKISTLPGVLLITFIILILVTAILSIILTYFQLTWEDQEWPWRSVLRGGAVAICMFAYSIHFYSRSSMSGVMQTTFFFGYTACMCYAFFLMLGTISFWASLIFVQCFYPAVKSE